MLFSICGFSQENSLQDGKIVVYLYYKLGCRASDTFLLLSVAEHWLSLEATFMSSGLVTEVAY